LRVFISWSGPRSRAVAMLLREWLPLVLNAVVPFMSSEDIPQGSQWLSTLNDELSQAAFAIVCVTPENQGASWLNFEAGAIAKAVGETRVCPLLLGIGSAEVRAPLSIFQMANATEDDVLKLIKSINSQLTTRLSDERLVKIFQKWWPELETGIGAAVATQAEPIPAPRNEEDLTRETLLAVREQTRLLSQIAASVLPAPAVVEEKQALMRFEVGDSVVHPKWGEGKVLRLIEGGPETLISIEFPNIGEKLLMPKYATLAKVRAVPAPRRAGFRDARLRVREIASESPKSLGKDVDPG